MISSPSGVPWRITGNHWITVPCIDPADASIYLIGAVHAGARGAVEFAGSAEYANGEGNPLARLAIVVDGVRHSAGVEGISWDRDRGWLPSFECQLGSIAVKATICCPHGADADLAGVVFAVTITNTTHTTIALSLELDGTLGHRQLRVRTSSAFTDAHKVTTMEDMVVLHGASAVSHFALAIGGDGDCVASVTDSESPVWVVARSVSLEPGETRNEAFYIAAGSERDGAVATLAVMKRRGWSRLIESTQRALAAMTPTTGSDAADRLITANMLAAYFCSIARAIDDAHVYVVRSRLPWNGRGLTIRDWEALMWVLPAVQLADAGLARELLLRICELHGHAPGGGVHYLDGSVFEAGFSLEGAAAFPIAVDAYIVHTGDDKIVEDPVLADSLYGANEDIAARRDARLSLYSTEVNPDGSVPAYPYTTHGNALVALGLDILRHTLDEKTSEKVPDSAAVRAAVLRHLVDETVQSKREFAASSNLVGKSSNSDEPGASLYWLPYFDLANRDDSAYRRTVKRLIRDDTRSLAVRCARLVGVDSSAALHWLCRAPLDGGIAAEFVDDLGRVTGNGGDAALSGLLAYTAWYSVHALGATVED